MRTPIRPRPALAARLAALLTLAAACGGCALPAARQGDAAEATTAPGPAACARLADAIDAHLRRDVLARWFPACVDTAGGGFHQVLSRDWKVRPDDHRFLVYQARQTWVAAQAALYDPALAREFTAYALHGLVYLTEVFGDREAGGLYFRLDPAGRATDAFPPEKHAYGLSFAIYAGAAVYEATKDPRALALAVDTFRWLDDHAHDAAQGGYFEAMARDGRPITAPPKPGAVDGIGTPYGYKSMNTHIHLLEALAALQKVWPNERVRERLEELLALVRDRIAITPGALNYYFTPDWRPVPMHDSFGHDIETAFLMVEAADVLGRPDDEPTWRMARALVDHALDWGWDAANGGFYYSGQAFAPAFERQKSWWVQAEGLNVLLLMHERYGAETDRYWKAFLAQWRFIRDCQADRACGGWYAEVTEGGSRLGTLDKASPWKAAYHNVRALMNTVRRLRRLAERGAPAGPAAAARSDAAQGAAPPVPAGNRSSTATTEGDVS